MSEKSPAQWLAENPDLLEQEMARMSVEQKAALNWQWRGWWARPSQLAPEGDWDTWLILSGRGFGKTRTGVEWLREQWKAGISYIAIIAETAADARDVLVEGPSGILKVSPKHERPDYEPSKRRLTWPNGATATLYNGTEPDQLRGPQHEAALVDELAKYKYPEETWDMLQFGMRIGHHPRVCVTTTPRPIPIIHQLISDPTVTITTGSTYDNMANLSPQFIKRMKNTYEGTRLGQQELLGLVLSQLVGAIWSAENIEKNRKRAADLPEMERIVVGVDPSGAKNELDDGADEIGIIVAGKGVDQRGYILEDATLRGSPDTWGKAAVSAYHRWKADRIVAEINFGGALVEFVIRAADPNVSFKAVTASRGKVVRAEPVAALYEQDRVSHVGMFSNLEDQMLHFGASGFTGSGSPDRADAAVWALTDLMLAGVEDMEWVVGGKSFKKASAA